MFKTFRTGENQFSPISFLSTNSILHVLDALLYDAQEDVEDRDVELSNLLTTLLNAGSFPSTLASPFLATATLYLARKAFSIITVIVVPLP